MGSAQAGRPREPRLAAILLELGAVALPTCVSHTGPCRVRGSQAPTQLETGLASRDGCLSFLHGIPGKRLAELHKREHLQGKRLSSERLNRAISGLQLSQRSRGPINALSPINKTN